MKRPSHSAGVPRQSCILCTHSLSEGDETAALKEAHQRFHLAGPDSPGAAHGPFLKNAHLLVAADCTPMAYPDFHARLLKGKVVLMGCPKFDDVQDYIDRFAAIFSASDIGRSRPRLWKFPVAPASPTSSRRAWKRQAEPFQWADVISTRGGILEQHVA